MEKRLDIFDNCDFSDCREITGDELFKINGGKQVENSNEGVANAQPGDTIIREDKTEITLNQGDIDWAQAHIDSGNDSTQAIPESINTPSMTTNPTIDTTVIIENITPTKKVLLTNSEKPSESIITNKSDSTSQYIEISKNKKNLIAEEKNIKSYLKKIEQNPDNYSIEAYQRKALCAYKGKINKTLTHSLYVITDKSTGEKSTLSFNGTGPIGFISKGAWGLNTKTDVKGWNSYIEGKNNYDMSVYRSYDGIDVQKTTTNIILSLNSNTLYMAIDHKWDWSNYENCNTALYNTIAKKRYNCFLLPANKE